MAGRARIEAHLGILQRLHALKASGDFEKIKRHNVLNLYRNEKGELGLEVLNYDNLSEAIAKASELESGSTSLNAVYVRADNPKQVRSAYRNYFTDPVDLFVWSEKR